MWSQVPPLPTPGACLQFYRWLIWPAFTFDSKLPYHVVRIIRTHSHTGVIGVITGFVRNRILILVSGRIGALHCWVAQPETTGVGSGAPLLLGRYRTGADSLKYAFGFRSFVDRPVPRCSITYSCCCCCCCCLLLLLTAALLMLCCGRNRSTNSHPDGTPSCGHGRLLNHVSKQTTRICLPVQGC